MEQAARGTWMSFAGRFAGHAFAVGLLTVLTQIGGLIWLLTLALSRFLPWRSRRAIPALFVALYAVSTFGLHLAAPLTGRVPLPCFPGAGANLAVATPLYCALNRNYVTPELKRVAEAYAAHMAEVFPGTRTLALDGNFPLVTGFPLLPHLSHDDGRKLDLALYYSDETGKFRNGELRSPLGYFAFQQPRSGAPLPCASRHPWLTLRWDLAWLQPLFADWDIEDQRVREALRWLSFEGRGHGIEKVFIEPHLAARVGVTNATIRFQGCRAARHDDHIHIQTRD